MLDGRARRLTQLTTQVLGRPVGVALPVQRHSPKMVLFVCAAELAAVAGFIATASPAALAAIVVVAVALLALAATNRKRVLAVTSDGVAVTAASVRGRPLVEIGTATVDFPPPSGAGVPVVIDGTRWWVDRTAFARLARARELTRR
jgi:hypothetical protein